MKALNGAFWCSFICNFEIYSFFYLHCTNDGSKIHCWAANSYMIELASKIPGIQRSWNTTRSGVTLQKLAKRKVIMSSYKMMCYIWIQYTSTLCECSIQFLRLEKFCVVQHLPSLVDLFLLFPFLPMVKQFLLSTSTLRNYLPPARHRFIARLIAVKIWNLAMGSHVILGVFAFLFRNPPNLREVPAVSLWIKK